MPRRRYDRHRHAYTPRLWPMLVATMPVSYVTVYALVLSFGVVGIVVGLAFAVGLGFMAPTVRWWLWRRRHPLSPCGPGCWMWAAHDLNRHAQTQRQTARWQ